MSSHVVSDKPGAVTCPNFGHRSYSSMKVKEEKLFSLTIQPARLEKNYINHGSPHHLQLHQYFRLNPQGLH